MNNRVLVAGLIGGIAFFFLGFLMYGFLVRDLLDANTMAGLNRGEDDMQFAYLILGNLAFGFLLAYLLNKANARTASTGAQIGLAIGLLTSLGVNLVMYATTNYWSSLSGVLYDVLTITVMNVIVGALIGWWYGRGHKTI
jgi:hypothetical protein